MIDQETFERIGQRIPAMLLEYFDAARFMIAADATSTFMQEGKGAAGPNPNVGPGSLRIVSGRLSRSLVDATESRTSTREGISEVEVGSVTGRMKYGSRVPYAAVHEEGFSGTVRVGTHTRTITQAWGRQITPVEVTIPAHTRLMNVPKRPYLGPAQRSTQEELTARLAEMMHEILQEELA